MTAETFDAVLADVMGAPVVEDRHFDRLAAAHAAEMSTRDESFQMMLRDIGIFQDRAEAATALLRECLQFVPDDLAARIAGMVGQ